MLLDRHYNSLTDYHKTTRNIYLVKYLVKKEEQFLFSGIEVVAGQVVLRSPDQNMRLDVLASATDGSVSDCIVGRVSCLQTEA